MRRSLVAVSIRLRHFLQLISGAGLFVLYGNSPFRARPRTSHHLEDQKLIEIWFCHNILRHQYSLPRPIDSTSSARCALRAPHTMAAAMQRGFTSVSTANARSSLVLLYRQGSYARSDVELSRSPRLRNPPKQCCQRKRRNPRPTNRFLA